MRIAGGIMKKFSSIDYSDNSPEIIIKQIEHDHTELPELLTGSILFPGHQYFDEIMYAQTLPTEMMMSHHSNKSDQDN